MTVGVVTGAGSGMGRATVDRLIDTPMGRQEFEQQPVMKSMLDNTPLGRLGTADEVAAVVAFLLSDDAAFVSGIDVLVDGAPAGAMRGRP